jgi:trk system potassium uptake protein TrkH
MFNFRIIARVFSLMLIVEGLFMLLSAGVASLYHEHTAASFLYSALITVFTGIIVFTPLRNEERVYGNKEGYLIVTGLWILLSLFGTLPYILSGSITSFGDAFFESISGFSTTGATILNDVEKMPHGILFWRSLTQWIGGIGIIFISLSIIPVFKAVNIQLAASEFSGHPADKIHPRIFDAAKRLILIYLVLTLTEVALLAIGGMPVFDSVCHSLSTLSTGGFSTKNNGIAAFSTPYMMVILTIFMFLAGINMSFVYFGLKGNFRKVFGQNEFFFYSLLCLVFALIISAILYYQNGFSAGKALLDGTFHVISIVTTTGFYTQNYNLWGSFIIMMFFVLMFTGGTSGSTSGGVKIIRLLLITKNTKKELNRLIHPYGFMPVRVDKRIIPQSTVYNILVFITIYFLLVCSSSFILSFMGFDIVTSFSTAAAMIANIGPGLGEFGPFSSFSELPMSGKMFLSGLMLLGRLEILTVMILFTRNFYRH